MQNIYQNTRKELPCVTGQFFIWDNGELLEPAAPHGFLMLKQPLKRNIFAY
jgi:hypothetical protein